VATFEDAATWPDCVRPLRDGRFGYLAVDHYEDVPLCGVALKATYCPDGRCITDEARLAMGVLKDRRRSATERLQALEEVAHFIGDIHQPLHAADNGDHGGNLVRVRENGDLRTNLHHLWDDTVVEYAVGTDEASAEAALRPSIAAHAKEWSAGDVDGWLMESHQIAVHYVYAKLAHPPACGQVAEPQEIGREYLEGAKPIVRAQLAKAGVRLALVLNQALQ
jgi:hypothetical protein